jgi:archaeoflavoprotein AfpA
VKIAWGISGSGDFLQETISVIRELVKRKDLKVTVFLSKAAVNVVKWYGLWDALRGISPNPLLEEGPNQPFIAGALQKGKYKLLLIAPATANTVAKVAHGIADSLVTNAVSQALKGCIPVFILPVDQKAGTTVTVLPTGEKLEITVREVDAENVEKLRCMKGLTVLRRPEELLELIEK